MASTTASNLAGAWFGELASALQGTWQEAAAASHGDPRPRHQQQPPQKLGRGGDDEKAVQGAAAAGGKAAQDKEGDVVRCGGAMSDTTLYLLLDRFSPS
jgi:hypothetical protein